MKIRPTIKQHLLVTLAAGPSMWILLLFIFVVVPIGCVDFVLVSVVLRGDLSSLAIVMQRTCCHALAGCVL